MEDERRMIIARTIGKIMFPMILVLAVAMGAFGHLSPGGAFPAGVIAATAFLLLYVTQPDKLAGNLKEKLAEEYSMSSAGVMGLMLIALGGLVALILNPATMVQTPGNLFSALSVLVPNMWGILSIGMEIIVLIMCFMPRGKK